MDNKKLEAEAKMLWYKLDEMLNKKQTGRIMRIHGKAWRRWKRRNDAMYKKG